MTLNYVHQHVWSFSFRKIILIFNNLKYNKCVYICLLKWGSPTCPFAVTFLTPHFWGICVIWVLVQKMNIKSWGLEGIKYIISINRRMSDTELCLKHPNETHTFNDVISPAKISLRTLTWRMVRMQSVTLKR